MTDDNDEQWGPIIAYDGCGRPEGLASNAQVRFLTFGSRVWMTAEAGQISWNGSNLAEPILVYQVRKEAEKVTGYAIIPDRKTIISEITERLYCDQTHKLTWNKADETKDTFTITVERL